MMRFVFTLLGTRPNLAYQKRLRNQRRSRTRIILQLVYTQKVFDELLRFEPASLSSPR